MKVLLLNPPTLDDKQFIREGRCTQEQGMWATLWPPVSLATIAAVLLEDGHDVKLLDCPASGVSMAGLESQVSSFSPNVAIWSTGTPSISSDLKLAELLKGWQPAVWTGVFGTHVTALDQDCMERIPSLDGIIRHEPEYTVRELIQAVQAGSGLEQVQGLTYRADRRILRNPDRPFIQDLDNLPMPAWQLLDARAYRLPLRGEPFLMVAPLRGCPFPCSFCTAGTYYGRKLRRRSADKVIAEIRRDRERFGISHFFFWADTFIVDKQYVRELCLKILDQGLRISWTTNSRVDTVDPEILRLMARAGCWMISFGIESADQGVLDRANKNIRVEQAGQAVRWAHEAGLQVAGHFMFGLPGETKETMEATSRFARDLDVDFAQFYCAVPFPGSSLYELAKARGWMRSDDFSHFKQEEYVMAGGALSSDEIVAARDRAHRAFYLRPRTVMTVLKNAKVNNLAWLFAGAKRFLINHFQD